MDFARSCRRGGGGGSGVVRSSATVPCSGKNCTPAVRGGLAQFVAILLTLIGGGFLALLDRLVRCPGGPGDVGKGLLFTLGLLDAERSVGVLLFPRVRRALALPGGYPGDSRGGGRVDHLGARGRHLGQLDRHRPDRQRDHLCQVVGSHEAGAQIAELILMLAVAGVVAGSIHALAVPFLIVALVVFGWFAAALGVWISLQLRSTWRAQFLTIAGLLLINVMGQGLLNALSRFGFAPGVWPGFTPYEVTKLLLDPQFLQRLSVASWPRSWWLSSIDDGLAWQTIFTILSVVSYAALAAVLTRHSLRRFEVVAGRGAGPRTHSRSHRVTARTKVQAPRPAIGKTRSCWEWPPEITSIPPPNGRPS